MLAAGVDDSLHLGEQVVGAGRFVGCTAEARPAERFDLALTFGVRLRLQAMDAAVDLDNEAFCDDREVCDVGADGVLTADGEAVAAELTKGGPGFGLGRSWCFA